MNGEDPIDLSALDPSRDEVRWQRMIAAVTQRAVAQTRATVARTLRAWARPTLALAVALAVVVWAGAFLRHPRAATVAPADLLTQWAVNDDVPSTTSILEALGDDHVED